MAVGPLGLFALIALGPLVTADLRLGPSQFGGLATISFIVAAPCAWLLGRWVDRYSARTIIFSLLAVGALSLGVLSAATSYRWLVAGVLLAGIAMSVTNPVTNRLVSVQVGPGQRGAVMGVKQSGVQIAQLLIGLTLPSVAILTGWRGALATTVTIVVLGVVLTHRYVPAARPRPSAARGDGAKQPLPYQVWLLLGYGFVSGAALQATIVHLPLFAFQQVSFSVAAAGLIVALLGGVGLIARVAWGRVTERSADPRQVLVWIGLGGATATCLFVAAAQWQMAWLVWSGTVLTGATAVAGTVVVMTAAVRVVPAGSIGAASGLLAVGQYGGFALGPVSFGVAVEAAGYTWAWVVVAVVYAAAAALVAASRFTTRATR